MNAFPVKPPISQVKRSTVTAITRSRSRLDRTPLWHDFSSILNAVFSKRIVISPLAVDLSHHAVNSVAKHNDAVAECITASPALVGSCGSDDESAERGDIAATTVAESIQKLVTSI